MLLKTYGKREGAQVAIAFTFRWGNAPHDMGWVRIYCASRSAAARVLWKYRRARRWWRSVPVPGSGAWLRGRFAEQVSRFGLRWLAARWCTVSVSSPHRVGLRFVVPAGHVRRPSVWSLLSDKFVPDVKDKKGEKKEV